MRYTLTMIAALLVFPLAALRAADDDLDALGHRRKQPHHMLHGIPQRNPAARKL